MDENAARAGRDAERFGPDAQCTCCGRRAIRERVQVVVSDGVPQFISVCPDCDLSPAEQQGWIAEIPRE
ncbi:hypothetical protein [Pseudonocardia phyllosphaerae]|uniref:hypothetical protein n=1 Tax=Pseudonocardia phyllosphaerae TaxID=3390502 RepID=UPI00397B61C7